MTVDQILLLQNNNFAASGIQISFVHFVGLLSDWERIDQTNIAVN
jgi:hypothetical protein